MNTKNQPNELMKCYEIAIHYKRAVFKEMEHIKSSNDADTLIRKFADTNQIDLKECFWVMCLNNANRVLGIATISMGSSNQVAVNVKEICQLAVLCSSMRVIVIHNHPSGTLHPSKLDKQITTKIQKALQLFDVRLLDHIIITSENHFSFANDGLI